MKLAVPLTLLGLLATGNGLLQGLLGGSSGNEKSQRPQDKNSYDPKDDAAEPAKDAVYKALSRNAGCDSARSYVFLPNVLEMQECMKKDNTDMENLVKEYLNSNLYDEATFPGGEILIELIPPPEGTGVIDLTGLTLCLPNGTDLQQRRITRVLVTLTKIVNCINPTDLASPTRILKLAFQVGAIVYYLLQNLLDLDGVSNVLQGLLWNIPIIGSLLG